MPARRILLVDANRLTAYLWRPGHTQHEAGFVADPAGLAAFSEYLRTCRSSLFYLLADVAEEGFQVEEVPFVRGRDREALIQRKLAQYYYGTPLAMAISLGRTTEGRRDERLLFSGLSSYGQFEPWLLAMREAEAQLAGVYAVPMILAEAVSRQMAGIPQALLISASQAGLRQTFFDHGQLRFSRLTPVANSIDELADACATETDKMVQYLTGQRMIARGTPLPTFVLAHPAEFPIIGRHCNNSEKSVFEFLDLVTLSRQHGQSRAPGNSMADSLLLHLLATRTPRQQFAPAEDRHFFRLWQLRFGLHAAGVGVLAASLLFALVRGIDLYSLSEQERDLAAQIQVDKRRYDSILETLPKIPLSNDDLRSLTDRTDLMMRRSPGLEPVLAHLSRGLARNPRIELARLDWRLANRPDDTAAPGDNPRETANGDGSFILLDVEAQLPLAMVGDHRAQIETVNALIDSLKGEGIELRIVTLPFETESGKLLKSGAESAARIDPPRFAFRMVRKL